MSQVKLDPSAASQSASKSVWIELWLTLGCPQGILSHNGVTMYTVDSIIKQHNLIIRSENLTSAIYKGDKTHYSLF